MGVNPILDRHPLSEIWGDVPDDEYMDMLESVRQHGLLDRLIVTLDDQVLDGWHRYVLANLLDIPVTIAEYGGDDPAEYVIAKNAMRRHLTAERRAACVVACHEWRAAGRPATEQENRTHEPDSTENPATMSYFSAGDNNPDTGRLNHGPATEQEMADQAGVSIRTIRRAKAAHKAGLGEQTRSGELSLTAAAAQAKAQDDPEPDKPRPPTRTERLTAENEELRSQLAEKSARLDDLIERVQYLEAGRSTDDRELDGYFETNQTLMRTQQKSINEWIKKHGDLTIAHNALRRTIKTVERRLAEEESNRSLWERRAGIWERRAKASGWTLETDSPETYMPEVKIMARK